MNAKVLMEKADLYFKELGDEIPTVSGLALAIGLESRSELLNFDANPKAKKVIKNALLRLESILESRLYKKETYSGAKTVLSSNFGWQESGDDSKTLAVNQVKKLLEGIGD